MALAVVLLPLAIAALPHHASADTSRINLNDLKSATYSWVDRTTINMKVGGDTIAFKDSDITDVGLGNTGIHYTATGYGCGADIFVLVGQGWNNLVGTFKYNSTTNGSTGCSDTYDIKTSQAQNSGNSALVYGKQDDKTIVRLDGNTEWTFTLTNTPNVYGKTSEQGKSCQDRIIVNSSGQMSLYVLNPTPGGLSGALNGGQTGNGNTYRGLSDNEVHQLGLSGGESCVALNHDSGSAEKANGGAFLYAGRYSPLGTAANVKAAGAEDSAATSGITAAEDPALHCNITVLNPLSWFLCPLAHTIMNAISSLDNVINSYLNIDTNQIFGDPNVPNSTTNPGYKKAWGNIRDLSLGIVVVMALVMVVSQAAGLEIFDAYTVRKVFPRLLIAAIGIALSWSLLKFFVGFTNDLGYAARSIIYSPFGGAGGTGENGITLGGGGETLTTILGFTGIISLGFFGLLSFAATGLMALAVAIFVLIVRQIAMTILIIMAPLAIAAFILPNTQKMYKIWWDFLSKGLLMFPIIAAFIAAGRVFAVVSSNNGGTINEILSFIGYIAPYFLLPVTFRFAGGAIGAIGGFANNGSKGAFDRLKKYRGNKSAQNMQKAKNYSRFSDNNRVGRGINTLLGAGGNPRHLRRGVDGVRTGRQAVRGVQGQNALKNDAIFQANQNDDNFLVALADRNLATERLGSLKTKHEAAVAAHNSAIITGQPADFIEKKRQEMAGAQGQIHALENGMNAANQVSSRNSIGTQIAAYDAWTKTGYNIDAGAEGYKQLDKVATRLSGGDAGLRSQLLDQGQFNLKQAGRYDLGGINHGAGYSSKTGLNKASLYAIANGKTESIKTMVDDLGTTGPVTKEHAVVYKELQAMLPNATGGNRDEIVKQMSVLTSMGGGSGLKSYLETPTGAPPVNVRENYDNTNPAHLVPGAWSSEDQTRGYKMAPRAPTLGDQAQLEARTYQQPDPNNL
jgi:hypothetical protein